MMLRKGSKNTDHTQQILNDDEKEQTHVTPKGDMEDSNEGVIAFCHCKHQMIPVCASMIYEKFVPVFCNDCWSHVPAEKTVYHCTKGIKGRCWEHPVGYDICVSCAKKQMKKTQNAANHKTIAKSNPKNEDKNLMKKLFSRSRKDISDKEERSKALELNISPTLQCILTQQLLIPQGQEEKEVTRVNHLSVIDEVTRLSALSSSTLNQLAYANKTDKTLKHSLRDLQDMVIKYNALQQLQHKLVQSIQTMSVNAYKMIEDRLHQWENWDKYEVCEWIMSLDEGRFYKKYCVKIDSETDTINIVKESIVQQNICGKHLGLDEKRKDILIQSLGINDFDDRMALLDHIQNLTSRKFTYHQVLALVPAKKSEIPGHTIEEKDDLEEHNEEVVKGNDNPGMVPEIEGVDLNNNDSNHDGE